MHGNIPDQGLFHADTRQRAPFRRSGTAGHRRPDRDHHAQPAGGLQLDRSVDRAKARLWDLEQLQKGVLQDLLGVPMRQASFELLACPPAPLKTSSLKRQVASNQILEAAETLEREADKFDIRWRFLKTAADVAHSILSREAA